MPRTVLGFIAILISIPAWGGPGLDVRPQMGSSSSAEEPFQNLDLIFLQATNLVCEQSVAQCVGASSACGQALDAVSCVDMDPALECKWSCE